MSLFFIAREPSFLYYDFTMEFTQENIDALGVNEVDIMKKIAE